MAEEEEKVAKETGFNVDICATILADKPPQLPLREELNSLGFEIIYKAYGTGLKASQKESLSNVEKFRRRTAYRDLKKLRFFPKSSKRIREKLQQRQLIEQEIALPHACSYKFYEHELRNCFSERGFESEDEEDEEHEGGPSPRRKRRNHPRNNHDSETIPQVQSCPSEFQDVSDAALFPDFLAPLNNEIEDRWKVVMEAVQKIDNNSSVASISPKIKKKASRSTKKHSQREESRDQKVDVVISSNNLFPTVGTAMFHATHVADVPTASSSSDSSSNSTCVFDGILDEDNETNSFSTEGAVEEKKEQQESDKVLQSQNRKKSERENQKESSMKQKNHQSASNDTLKATPPEPTAPVVQQHNPEGMENQLQNIQNAFDRATEEIRKVVGISPNNKVDADEGRKSDYDLGGKKQFEQTNWMSSTKQVLDNFSKEVMKAALGEKKPNDESEPKTAFKTSNGVTSTNKNADISVLFAVLSRNNVAMSEIESVLESYPELLQVRQESDGRLPLHALCSRKLPERKDDNRKNKLTDLLTEDIQRLKHLVTLLHQLHPDAALIQDKRGDLPVHLLARNLMEWEATWYENVYQKAASEKGSGSTALAITRLYHAMSLSVETVLKPIVDNTILSSALCRLPGSMGTILPLHIATVFTVSVRTLRLTLEAHPEAAKVHCDLGILRTFIPDECLPLELHDNLSTDFPKWEIEQEKSGEEDENSEDCMRRSDLLFAYNPIEPFRFEKARIRRLESRIQLDATMVIGKKSKRLNRAHELLWIWMCTFREKESDRPTYVNSVKRIVGLLPLPSLRALVSIKTENDEQLIDVANIECLKVLQKRTEHITKEAKPPEKEVTNDMIGLVSRLLFNVPATQHPTSFIILPYKLQKDENGSLVLESPNDSKVAAKFAESLMNMTDPRSILYVLDSKSMKYYGESLYSSTSTEAEFFLETFERMKSYEDSLLSLYEEKGYLYVIDEEIGLPQVNPNDPVYPIHLHRPGELVQQLLPLMIMGMTQMRGEKAVQKLIDVLLDKRVAVVPANWKKAAEKLITYLDSQNKRDFPLSTGLIQSKHSLQTFCYRCSSKLREASSPRNGTTEWNKELSLLKSLLFKHDKKRHFSGVSFPFSADFSTEDENFQKRQEGKFPYCSISQNRSKLVFEEDEPDVDDLSRKMDALSQLQRDLAEGGTKRLDTLLSKSPHQSFDDNIFLQGNTFSAVEENDSSTEYDPSTLKKGRNRMLSKYAMLFDDFKRESPAESRDPEEYFDNVRIWNESERVWEEVTCQLNHRAETFCEDSQILQLKVALAEQAEKLASLGKKVSSLKDQERELFAREIELIDNPALNESDYDSSRDSLSEARRLVMRMCDLEERLMCDEIRLQHLSMEAFQVGYEGEEMSDGYGDHSKQLVQPERMSYLTTWNRDPAIPKTESFSNWSNAPNIKKPQKTVRFTDMQLNYGHTQAQSDEPPSVVESSGYYSNDSSSSTESVRYLMTISGDLVERPTATCTIASSSQDSSSKKSSTTDTGNVDSSLYAQATSYSKTSKNSPQSDEAVVPSLYLTLPPTNEVRFSRTPSPPSPDSWEPQSNMSNVKRHTSIVRRHSSSECDRSMEQFSLPPYSSRSLDSSPRNSQHFSGGSKSTEFSKGSSSVFRSNGPISTIYFNNGVNMPPQAYSGLSERTDSYDLSLQMKQLEIDMLISKYTSGVRRD